MTNSKLRFVFPLAIALATASAAAVAHGQCESGGCSGDAKITTNVQELFQQHPELGAPNLISVQTLDHVVYLSGEASAGEFSAVAESAAHEVPGVVRVVNSITVTH
jgi:osmotically-inducible protein OsmY